MPTQINSDLMNELLALGERLTEDRLYEIAIQEIEMDDFDAVAKARALEEAEGDGNKARAFYIKHRVRRIRDILTEQAFAQAEIERIAEVERIQAERRATQELTNVKFKLGLEKLEDSFFGLFQRKFKPPVPPVEVYKGQPIYEQPDGYRAMGAWFGSVAQAKTYIDNNRRLYR
jgi:hypothetical protein